MTPSSAAPVLARPASTVVALRQSYRGLEVLLVRRSTASGFMAGAHVFPGGGVDAIDGGAAARAAVRWTGDESEFAWRAAALRELAEEATVVLSDRPVDLAGLRGALLYQAVSEAGAALDADRLLYLSNWITPVGVPRRFDTRFFLVALDTETEAVTDDEEVFDAVWVSPAAALDHGAAGTWQIEFPTRVHLELLDDLGSVDAAIDHAVSTTPVPIQPTLVTEADGSIGVRMPAAGEGVHGAG